MGLFDKLFKRQSDDDGGEDAVITLDLEARRPQLLRLEQGLDSLSRAMRDVQTVDNPGWRGRINEYSRLAGDAMVMRKGTPTREGVLDLVFEVRPVFTAAGRGARRGRGAADAPSGREGLSAGPVRSAGGAGARARYASPCPRAGRRGRRVIPQRAVEEDA